ncbi:unnamed protein product [Miscanthus lutarioriparius]|uniref:NAC domain-containing protein n=1 Tax=Miscanthus lutarioriparius TaxID=422564 RepID=A0A811PKQ3_9POAL|nr:unnamed protein product [Miscanthus lutarioriparius]
MDEQQQQQQQAPCVPPGFRFHPTEEELVGYYLARKVASQKIDLHIIRDVDLYRIEPWDLQGMFVRSCSCMVSSPAMDDIMTPIVDRCMVCVRAERCGYYGGSGGGQDQEEPTEYYFFSYKDRKYPSGTRTNRATAAGFWKATGRDKPVLSSTTTSRSSAGSISVVIGMRKTLVFYRGRAPNGRKTDWIIHEYRLQSNEHAPTQEEGWVVCRAFQKPMPNQQHIRHAACYYPPPPGSYASTMPDTYYYDGPAPAARLLMSGGAPAPPAAHDHGGLVAESKLQVQLLADMPPLQSPSVDGVVQHHSYNDQVAAAAVAAESTVDWNLLSSLLPPAQLNFHHTPPAASPSSCSKNNNDA